MKDFNTDLKFLIKRCYLIKNLYKTKLNNFTEYWDEFSI